MRIVVTGSRNWTNGREVWSALDRVLHRSGRIVLKHGLCPNGADAHALKWALSRPGRVVEKGFRANWDLHGAGAGFRRNAEMIASGADMVLVFALPCRNRKSRCPALSHPSHGTKHCVDEAWKASIPVYFCPEGMSWKRGDTFQPDRKSGFEGEHDPLPGI